MAAAEEEGEWLAPRAASVAWRARGADVVVGVAVVGSRERSREGDQCDRLIELFQFDDCAQLTNLESALLRADVRRCYVAAAPSSGGALHRRADGLLEALGIESQALAKASFKASGALQDLPFLTGAADGEPDAELVAQQSELELALAALHALVQAEEYLAEGEALRGRFEVTRGQLQQYVRLDAAAVEALNLFPRPGCARTAHVREASLLGVLDHCRTKQLGSRLLRRWLRQPLRDLEQLQWRQQVVGALKDDGQRRQTLQDALKGVPDLDRLMRKLQLGKAGLRELYELLLFVRQLPRVAAALAEDEAGETQAGAELRGLGAECGEMCDEQRFAKFVGLVESVLDMDLAPEEFRVKPVHDKSGELQALADELARIDERKEEVRQELEDGPLQGMNARFETEAGMLKTYGFHFRVAKKHDTMLKKVKGAQYKYLNVVAACIRWSSTGLRSLYDEYADTYATLQRKQLAIVQQAVEVAATFLPLFEGAAALVAKVDVLASLAHAAAYAGSEGYVRPTLHANGGRLRLSRARHPCLELLDDVEFIANDYELEADKSNFQIVTGPNMGGKSTYIRQLGTIAVMAQIGSFVPCEAAELPVVDAVLARVGASDAQLQGMSTFMAEMVEASAIVKTATKDSLVIIDELGRGTSTYDGFGLAWAISEHLARKVGPMCLFATHFHELTALADHVPNVRNKHVTALATDDSITMLYTVNDGPCQQSFGINIAKMADFPPDVLEAAREKAEQLEALTVIASSNESNQHKRQRVEQARAVVAKLAKLDRAEAVDAAALRRLLASA